ncbi:ArsR/SmtB family transcription factor [Streptomyces yatensis]|uniref:ArsR/SmtB family transcription factor n=1 Tax=Streptomyces yatensis TaxID=155177 RepID=UPI001FE59CE7|nr:metalloregulator ArsR/SmtB family transcription factor [Streptomyces yatensis]
MTSRSSSRCWPAEPPEALRTLRDGEELTVGEVAERAGLGPSTTSEHLAVLRRGGLLQSTRSGKLVRYRADREGIAEMLGQLHSYLLAPSEPQDTPVTQG